MSIVCDIVLLAVFLLTVIVHTRKGFVESLLHTLSAVISAVCAVLFGPQLGAVLQANVFGERFVDKIYGIIEPMFSFVQDKVDLSAFLAESQSESNEFLDLISRMGVSIDELIQSFGTISLGTQEDIRNLARSIAAPVSETISKICGYALVFVGVLLALWILRLILKGVVKLPVLKQTNRLLGTVLGIVCGFVYVWFICIVLGGILEYGLFADAAGTFGEAINGSFLYRFFSKLSLIDLLSMQ